MGTHTKTNDAMGVGCQRSRPRVTSLRILFFSSCACPWGIDRVRASGIRHASPQLLGVFFCVVVPVTRTDTSERCYLYVYRHSTHRFCDANVERVSVCRLAANDAYARM